MYQFIVLLVFLFGTYLHIYFMQLNQVLKVADSFAYLQMAYGIKNFSIDGFGTGWFGPLYSIPIGITNIIVDFLGIHTQDNLFLSAQIVNIICLLVSGILIFKIGKLFLNRNYNVLLLILFFISPTLINYNIGILSENIYIPLFLGFFLVLYKLINLIIGNKNIVKLNGINFKLTDEEGISKYLTITSLILALMYYTRGEAFIYIGSISIIFFILLIRKDISIFKFLKYNFVVFIIFIFFISPYIYYLHTITGEWGLTNKGASNLRQAQMRGISKMDDTGFEKAVGELTPDKHHFIHGFIGGLKYDKPTSTGSLISYIKEDEKAFLGRFLTNQKKLYFKNIPQILIGESYKTYNDKNFYFYNNKLYLAFLLIPLVFLLYGTLAFTFNKEVKYTNKKNFIIITFSTFFVASIFFTIFFILDRYFIVFLPLALIAICYGIQNFMLNFDERYEAFRVIKYIIFLAVLISIFVLGNMNYFTYSKFDDKKYLSKKDAGLLLKQELNSNGITDTTNLRVMERFPVFTYYLGTKQRWLTPYTDKLEDLIEYAKYNKIDYLVVDTMDFETYRPGLKFLLDYETSHKGLELVLKKIKPGERVLIYKIEK